VGVIWDEDRGVVDLLTDVILMYCYGQLDGEGWRIPYVDIEDDDFWVLLPVDMRDDEDEMFDLAVWDNVSRLLKHPEFNLAHRLRTGRVV